MLILCVSFVCSCGNEGTQEIIGTYKIESNVYYSSLVNMAFNSTDKYEIEELDGEAKLSCAYLGVSGEEVSSEIGELEKISLKKSNFDKYIFGESWQDGASAENIRKNNKSSWKAEKKGGETVYILLQNDGTFFAVSIKTKDGLTSCAYIRKITLISK